MLFPSTTSLSKTLPEASAEFPVLGDAERRFDGFEIKSAVEASTIFRLREGIGGLGFSVSTNVAVLDGLLPAKTQCCCVSFESINPF